MVLLLSFLLGASASCATDDRAAAPGRPSAAMLDELFARLQATANPDEAEMIEVAIRHVWASSGRRSVDSLMGQAVEAVQLGDYELALKALDAVIRSAPDFAEGWNLRATVHYLREDYGAAVADIEHVLTIEPRHFGALAGLGRIFLELEDEKSALRAFEAALALNPHLDDVREEAEDLREQLAGIQI